LVIPATYIPSQQAPHSGRPALLESELGRGSIPFSERALSYVDGADGRQVEYYGHPLYLYAGTRPNGWVQGSGSGTGGTWFVVTPKLEPAV
jgi:hypothetical protein